jgi:hypothetical protein
VRYRPTALDWVARVYLGALIAAGVADLVGRALGFPPLLLNLMKVQ